jgi:hypothetical protein
MGKRLRDAAGKGYGSPLRLLDTGFREHDQELLAAPATTDIADPQRLQERPSDCRQDGVATVMAEPIVDALEIVKIEQQDRHVSRRAVRPRQFCLQSLQATLTRGATGELIDATQLL